MCSSDLAARAYVLAPDDASGRARAEAAARQALADQGVDAGPLDLTITCTPTPGRCHDGTSIVSVRIRTRVDLPLLPAVLGGGAPKISLDATQREPVGQYQEIGATP